MKSKAPLSLMEQMVMILVFALAAALCLQAFVRADTMSRRAQARDRAAVVCQSAAEAIRHSQGDLAAAAELLGGESTQELLWVDYDEQWAPTETGERYRLAARREDPDGPGLGKAVVWVNDEGDIEPDTLFQIELAWQTEVDGNG